MMSTWLYLFTKKKDFPEPLAEISALKAIDEEGDAFLLLAKRERPPGSKAMPGDQFALCTRKEGSVFCHALTTVAAQPRSEPTTPQTVAELYGSCCDRFFVKLSGIEMKSEARATDIIHGFTAEDERKWQKGKAFVKIVGASREVVRKRAPHRPPARHEGPAHHEGPAIPDRFHLRPKLQHTIGLPVTVMGLDPTAGEWCSRMMSGPKKMPSVRLNISASDGLPRITWGGVDKHKDNKSFLDCVTGHKASYVCIDGPCDTNGLRCLPDWSDWDRTVRGGVRDGERDLARAGIGLFWTTFGTIMGFDGASRWIARSLRLFRDLPQVASHAKIIETHPHAAFTMLWRACGRTDALPKKTGRLGQDARIAMLKTFIAQLNEEELNRDHDRIDAACAALVAAFHLLGLNRAFGTAANGGQVWVPDCKLFEVGAA